MGIEESCNTDGYYVACDAPGCLLTIGEDDPFSYNDVAAENAEQNGWIICDDERVYCFDHSIRIFQALAWMLNFFNPQTGQIPAKED